jgi:hypothetical protein
MAPPVRWSPSANVEAPPAIAPTASGLASLSRNHPFTDNRWMAGYGYVPRVPGSVIHNRSAFTGNIGANLGTGDRAGLIEVMPFILETQEVVSTFVLGQDPETKARELLEFSTSTLLEHELWTGEIAQADELPNRYLSDESLREGDILDATSIHEAVAVLVGKLSAVGMGQVMIHVPKRLGIMLPAEWKNDVTLREQGFVVVSGAGYPDDDGLIYATELVNVALAEIEVLPGSVSEAIDTGKNEVTYYAQRIGAVDFAGPVFACTVNSQT